MLSDPSGSFYKKAINLGVSVSSLKAPQISALSSSSTQSKYWEDVLTSHADDSVGRTWRVQEKRMGSSIFEVEEGVVQVRPTLSHSRLFDGTHLIDSIIGGLRDSLWQFRISRILNGRDKNVEYAIGKRTSDV